MCNCEWRKWMVRRCGFLWRDLQTSRQIRTNLTSYTLKLSARRKSQRQLAARRISQISKTLPTGILSRATIPYPCRHSVSKEEGPKIFPPKLSRSVWPLVYLDLAFRTPSPSMLDHCQHTCPSMMYPSGPESYRIVCPWCHEFRNYSILNPTSGTIARSYRIQNRQKRFIFLLIPKLPTELVKWRKKFWWAWISKWVDISTSFWFLIKLLYNYNSKFSNIIST